MGTRKFEFRGSDFEVDVAAAHSMRVQRDISLVGEPGHAAKGWESFDKLFCGRVPRLHPRRGREGRRHGCTDADFVAFVQAASRRRTQKLAGSPPSSSTTARSWRRTSGSSTGSTCRSKGTRADDPVRMAALWAHLPRESARSRAARRTAGGARATGCSGGSSTTCGAWPGCCPRTGKSATRRAARDAGAGGRGQRRAENALSARGEIDRILGMGAGNG
ncbi:MAG: hypothetical protein ACLR3C_15105 [Eggerthella lenta]